MKNYQNEDRISLSGERSDQKRENPEVEHVGQRSHESDGDERKVEGQHVRETRRRQAASQAHQHDQHMLQQQVGVHAALA